MSKLGFKLITIARMHQILTIPDLQCKKCKVGNFEAIRVQWAHELLLTEGCLLFV